VLLEEARIAAGEIPGMLAEPAPGVTFDPGFGDWSLGFTLGYSVAEFAEKRILKRLRLEKIDMPFPTRTVYVRNQGGSG
jgi:small-conductance mechanosensitive channel